ncbi:hypothetical protein EKO04_001930 [Ascochyta lentis]|uniref:Uncharacterized protein n=1 Tax=Ascochyta lentis TaxID=205686 RepID=A0A8H7MHB5_9PLEO|nr:hypothetical protein EKO04_001930 [Ascochyta lentis]
MKLLGLLLLTLVGICLAAPAPSNDLTPSAVQSFEDVNVNVPFKAPRLKPRNVTPDRATPENLYRVSISFSEYCDAGTLKARGWLSNGQVKFELALNAQQITKLTLHPGYDQVFGPYNFDSHSFGIEYDGCKWSSEGGYPCGWCEGQPWSLGPLNCQTGQPGNQRLTYRTCYFVDNKMPYHLSARDEENINPPTTTPSPTLPSDNDNNNNIINALASTLTLRPAIIQTTFPNTPSPQTSTILPFHLRIFESCHPGTPLTATAIYTNGNMAQALSLTPGLIFSVAHRVPGYSNLEIGPFDYAREKVRFRYEKQGGEECVWTDETWRSCGECRAGLWSGPLVDCGVGGVRWKEVDCSVLLGVK